MKQRDFFFSCEEQNSVIEKIGETWKGSGEKHI